MSDKKKFLTPKGRLSFPKLFKPEANKMRKDGKLMYSCTLIFDEEAQQSERFKALREAVKTLAMEKFGKDGKLPKNIKNPFRSGEEKEHLDGYGPGTVFVSANTQSKPNVVDLENNPLSEQDVYAGCYVHASVVPATYDVDGGRGVKLYLNNVQKLADGERLSGGASSAEDDFGAPKREPSSAAPQKDSGSSGGVGDDDIPFGRDNLLGS